MIRRSFLTQCAGISAGFLGLQRVLAKQPGPFARLGPLTPSPDVPLDLPRGFRASLVTLSGSEMDDGLIRPGKPDGMAAFAGDKPGEVVLVCNHELATTQHAHSPFGPKNERLAKYGPERLAKLLPDGNPYLGGTTTMSYDVKARRMTSQYLSFGGAERLCAGGPTPWGSWITCEEPELLDGPAAYYQDVGWCYEVPASSKMIDPPNLEPIRGMGRFRHEAVAIDPRTGIVYLTEDRGDGLFYRFRPTRPGKLHEGGVLEALALVDRKQADTRNWDPSQAPTIPVRKEMAVRWVPLEDIEAPRDDLRHRGFSEQGAAVFARGEGIWFGEGELFFACTNGGAKQRGQIFRYRPSADEGTAAEAKRPGRLDLFIEPNDSNLLEAADNLTVAPWGDLVVCEDGPGDQFLRGVTPEGELYTIARNNVDNGELAGACFAPNAPVLFVNLQQTGHTLAIEGPWPDA